MNKRKITIFALVLCVLSVASFGVYVYMAILPVQEYKTVVKLKDDGEYAQALLKFEEMGGYKDSVEESNECRLLLANQYSENKKYDEAVALYKELQGHGVYKEAVDEKLYEIGKIYYSRFEYDMAKDLFTIVPQTNEVEDFIEKCVLIQKLQGEWVHKNTSGVVDRSASKYRIVDSQCFELAASSYEFEKLGYLVPGEVEIDGTIVPTIQVRHPKENEKKLYFCFLDDEVDTVDLIANYLIDGNTTNKIINKNKIIQIKYEKINIIKD